MKRTIRRSNDTVIVEATGNIPEEEKIKVFKSINIETENAGLILIACPKCNDEMWYGRELLANFACMKCGSRTLLSKSNFKISCPVCGEKEVKKDQEFNFAHCTGGTWMTN